MSVRHRTQRKAHERFLADAFLRKAGLSGDLVDCEAPDFRLVLPDGTVGLEVTELFRRGTTPQNDPVVRESVIERTVREAQRLYEAVATSPLQVKVVFAPLFDPQKLRREKTAREIATLLLSQSFEPGEFMKWERRFGHAVLPREVTYVNAYRVPDGFRSHWTAPQAGWVATLRAVDVQSRVDDKAGRLKAYRQTVANAWLLIAVEGRFPSQFFDDEMGFDPHEISSPFDRTFLLDVLRGRLAELGHCRF